MRNSLTNGAFLALTVAATAGCSSINEGVKEVGGVAATGIEKAASTTAVGIDNALGRGPNNEPLGIGEGPPKFATGGTDFEEVKRVSVQDRGADSINSQPGENAEPPSLFKGSIFPKNETGIGGNFIKTGNWSLKRKDKGRKKNVDTCIIQSPLYKEGTEVGRLRFIAYNGGGEWNHAAFGIKYKEWRETVKKIAKSQNATNFLSTIFAYRQDGKEGISNIGKGVTGSYISGTNGFALETGELLLRPVNVDGWFTKGRDYNEGMVKSMESLKELSHFAFIPDPEKATIYDPGEDKNLRKILMKTFPGDRSNRMTGSFNLPGGEVKIDLGGEEYQEAMSWVQKCYKGTKAGGRKMSEREKQLREEAQEKRRGGSKLQKLRQKGL